MGNISLKTIINGVDITMKQLPRPVKVVAVHALRDLKFSIRNIAKILDIDKDSVETYIKENPDPTLDDFRTHMQTAFESREKRVLAKALIKIEEKMEDATFQEIVDFYNNKFQKKETAPPPTTPVFNQQINIEDTRKKFE